MISPLIVQEVFERPLCIDEGYAMSIATAVASMFFGITPHESVHRLAVSNYIEPYAFHVESATKQSKDYKPGSIGVVSIDGPILENSDANYGVMGTLQAAQAFQLHEADPNISAHLIFMNSGGGAAYAIKPFRDVLKSRTKPLVVFSNKILASAAYGLAASADFIIMYHPHGIVGSLGTMSSSRDMQPMLEKWGMKFNEFYATASTLKNKTYRDAKNGDPKALIQNVLDPMNETYLADIRTDRGDKISTKEKSIYQGETYNAARAVELGLIDAVGTMDEAIAKAFELGNARSTTTHVHNSQSNMKFTKVLALLAVAGTQQVTQQQLDEANAELAEAGITNIGLFSESVVTDASNVTTERDELALKVTNLEANLNTEKGKVTSLTAENEDLKQKVANAPKAAAPIVPNEDPKNEDNPEEQAAATIAALAHNQGVATNPLFSI